MSLKPKDSSTNISGVPLSRWQRKAMQQGISTLQVPKNSAGLSPGSKSSKSGDRSKTPTRTPHSATSPCRSGRTPRSLTPGNTYLGGRSPGRKGVSPGRDTTTDRFIPNRSAIDQDVSFYKLMGSMSMEESSVNLNPTELEKRQRMLDKMKDMNNGQPIEEARILHFGKDTSALNSNKGIMASASKSNKGKLQRYVPVYPEKILDAPELRDDYYVNVIDWSVNNHVAVALDNSVYIWDAYANKIFDLTMINAGEYIPCVRWIRDGGNILAIARSGSIIELWDVFEKKLVRKLRTHSSAVGALAWSSYMLASGEQLGNIHLHDVRQQSPLVSRATRHTQQVCNLAWSGDERLLASGANDNTLHVWETGDNMNTPLTSFQHPAAVKAFDWCPFQKSLLAAASGSPTSSISIFNVNNNQVLKSVDTDSQVTGLLWSKEYKEFVTCHGHEDGKLRLWKYPQLVITHTLKGHAGRVNCMTMSPNGVMVGSAGSDESIRLWKCFEKSDDKEKQKNTATKSETLSLLRPTIR